MIRGIYHDTLFAKWWAVQGDAAHERLAGKGNNLREHIHARFVMNNDLSWLSDATPDRELPCCIWFPNTANITTYKELVRRRPSMKMACVKRCMVSNDSNAFGRFGDVMPDPDLWLFAYLVERRQDEDDRAYYKVLEQKATEMGINLFPYVSEEEEARRDEESWPTRMVDDDWGNSGCRSGGSRTTALYREITSGHMGYDNDTPAVPGWAADGQGVPSSERGADTIELHVSALESVGRLIPKGYQVLSLVEVYGDGPYVAEEDKKMLGLYPNPARPLGGYRGRGGRAGRGRGGGGRGRGGG